MATDASARTQAERTVLAIPGSPGHSTLDTVLERTVEALQSGFPHYTGVYIYWLDGDTLVLRAFRGRPTEHVRIPVGVGICGRAARERQTVVVDDVGSDPAYLACSIETRSEMVVPVMRGTQVLGEIDIDSDVKAAFTADDRKFLEQLAFLIATKA
ncbi:MAG TPA: GAF domain-containing protein [Gemmatimonadales bacterium]|nr:GAF domain-containing protein [Gemmatimonadales bacterium]